MEYGLPDHKSSVKVFLTQMFIEMFGTSIWVMAFNYANKDPLTRAFAYFLTWIIGSTVSGAHFNPALSLAVYLSQKEYKKLLPYLICVWIS